MGVCWPRRAEHSRLARMASLGAGGERRSLLRMLPALCLITLAANVAADDDASTIALEKENTELQQRLKLLQERLKEEEKYSYVVSKGMIIGAENVYMETMELADAKQWCNSNSQCKGFTFLAPMDSESDQPDDEVKVTFKGESDGPVKVHPDSAYVSYVKHSAAASVLGAVGDAGMQLDGGSSYLVGQWLGFEAAALIFVLALAFTFGCRHRWKRDSAGNLLPR